MSFVSTFVMPTQVDTCIVCIELPSPTEANIHAWSRAERASQFAKSAARAKFAESVVCRPDLPSPPSVSYAAQTCRIPLALYSRVAVDPDASWWRHFNCGCGVCAVARSLCDSGARLDVAPWRAKQVTLDGYGMLGPVASVMLWAMPVGADQDRADRLFAPRTALIDAFIDNPGTRRDVAGALSKDAAAGWALLGECLADPGVEEMQRPRAG